MENTPINFTKELLTYLENKGGLNSNIEINDFLRNTKLEEDIIRNKIIAMVTQKLIYCPSGRNLGNIQAGRPKNTLDNMKITAALLKDGLELYTKNYKNDSSTIRPGDLIEPKRIMLYNILVELESEKYNLFGLNEDQLQIIIRAYLDGDDFYTTAGKKYSFINLIGISIYSYDKESDPISESEYYLNNTSFRKMSLGKPYLSADVMLKMGKEVTYEKIGNKIFGSEKMQNKEKHDVSAAESINTNSIKSQLSYFFENDTEFYLGGAFWSGEDMSEDFVHTNSWENAHEEKYVKLVAEVKIGSVIFLKSTFQKDSISYLRIKGAGVIIANDKSGSNLGVDWLIQGIQVDIEDLGWYRNTFDKVRKEDINIILDKLLNESVDLVSLINKVVSILNLDLDNNIIKNVLQQVKLNNDGAQTENDLLGFENDIRAFSSLIALKELQPPLAIALFGKWGSGKSFFMYNLQKRINYLSKNQGFEEMGEPKKDEDTLIEPFCKGIVHINFNAWSYMDANLWASLVANIFEKLDEYINEQTKSEIEKQKAADILNKNLSIVNDKKNEVIEQQKNILTEKKLLIEQIKQIEEEKKELLKNAEQKKHDEIYAEIRKRIPLENIIIEELKKYGIDEDKINKFSPDDVFNEVKSWVHFLRNLFQFTKLQLLGIAGALMVLIFVLLNPNGIIDHFVNRTGGLIVSFFMVAGPFLVRFRSILKQWIALYEPIKNYKNKFNLELDIIRQQYETNVRLVNQKLSVKNNELDTKNAELNNLIEEITAIEYQLSNSITGKAFFDFIKIRSKDERYDKNLSIITTIRRDFETLSELFRDFNIPKNLTEEEQKKAEEKKTEIETFKKLFHKPLDRIILYIDDLDRCSEDRVIEVLEAVNLLMAFPLFVVVVGVDPRWVKNALVKKFTLQFTGMLNSKGQMEKHGVEPIDVTDYLEKIFQIPFHLNEAQNNGVSELLNNIFDGQIKKEVIKPEPIKIKTKQNPALEFSELKNAQNLKLNFSDRLTITDTAKVHFRPEDLKISVHELQDLKDLSWLIGSNPRSIKRYANMYRLVRAHENLNYNEKTQRQDFLTVIFILGLSIGEYKNATKYFYEACLQNPNIDLNSIITELKDEMGKKLKKKMEVISLPENLKLLKGNDFNKYIPFVRRFSFENSYI